MSAPEETEEVVKMKAHRLGKTGLYVSELSFGCMTLNTGHETANTWGLPTATEETSFELVRCIGGSPSVLVFLLVGCGTK
jgi:hypothetical protein